MSIEQSATVRVFIGDIVRQTYSQSIPRIGELVSIQNEFGWISGRVVDVRHVLRQEETHDVHVMLDSEEIAGSEGK